MLNFHQLKQTIFLRTFTFFKIPLINWLKPVVLRMDDEMCQIKIPLNKRTHSHLGSMYFGALATGADLAGGLVALEEIQKSRKKISFVFKTCNGEFLKRATGDVIFTCKDVLYIRDLVRQAANSKDRIEGSFDVIATVPEAFKDEPVATFRLTISMKNREK